MPQRLDAYLVQIHTKFSRAFLQKFIREVGVRINGKLTQKANAKVNPGDKVEVSEKNLREVMDRVVAPKTDFKLSKKQIIFECDSFVVINKPPFVRSEDVISGFFPVHRLDKNTSGVLVAAKTPSAQAALQAQWHARKVKKTYIALVKDKLVPKRGAVEGSIFRSSNDRRKMAISSALKARASYTEYAVEKYIIPHTLLKAFPKTGRTHQIRVHFSSIRHPIIGDNLYGDKLLNKFFEQEYGLVRQFLHAAELTLTNPETEETVTFKSKLPEDLDKALKAFSKAAAAQKSAQKKEAK